MKLKSLPILDKYLTDKNLQELAIERALQMKNLDQPDFPLKDVAHGYFKLLHTICIVDGAETTAKILARMIYMAKDEKEVRNEGGNVVFKPVLCSKIEFLWWKA